MEVSAIRFAFADTLSFQPRSGLGQAAQSISGSTSEGSMGMARIGRVTRAYRRVDVEQVEEGKARLPMLAQKKLVGQPEVPIRQSSAPPAPHEAPVPGTGSTPASSLADAQGSTWKSLRSQGRKASRKKAAKAVAQSQRGTFST